MPRARMRRGASGRRATAPGAAPVGPHLRRLARAGALAAGLTLALGGCGGQHPPGSPPDVVPGRDACRECFMIVSELRFAAGRTDEDGLAEAFDDIGCMVRHYRAAGRVPERLWVADYDTGEWLDARRAFYVRGVGETPMGYGIVAVGTRQAADRLARGVGGAVLRFGDLGWNESTRTDSTSTHGGADR